MLAWLKKIFRREPAAAGITDAQRMAVVREAFRTGKPVMGNIGEDGKFLMQVIDEEK